MTDETCCKESQQVFCLHQARPLKTQMNEYRLLHLSAVYLFL